MSKNQENAKDDMDDIFVSPSIDNSKFLDLLSNLFSELSPTKWREVKSKRQTANELQILIETALELSSLNYPSALFRKRSDADDTLIGIWYAKVLQRAKTQILLAPETEYQKLTQEDLREIAQLSTNHDHLKQIPSFLFKKFGIVLIIEQGFSGMKLDGIAATLPTGHPLIALSLRYSRYDNFWFTLLHELSHIHLHGDLLKNSVIYDDLDEGDMSDVEREANRLAADSIVPRYLLNKSSVLKSNEEVHVYQLAKQASVHPILAAGAVRYYRNDYKLFSKMTSALNVRQLFGVEK